MKILGLSILLLSFSAVSGFAQQWEVGGMGGGSFLNSVAVNSSDGSARAGFQPGAAVGAFVGYDSYKHIGGELHYEFMQSDLKLSSGGSSATFSGNSQALHYDVIFHTASSESKVQLFAAVGGGMKIFRGTGAEESYQPLSQFGYFTKTQSLKPMASVGGGVKWSLSKKVYLRMEFRDYITAFPKDIITPAPGTKYGVLLHDFVPMIGLGFVM
jgi:hypothetical protein